MPLINFPSYTSRFIGREADAASVAALLQHKRLVTLVGTSGTGKTRLSHQIAQQLEAFFPAGCVFVNLAAIYTADLVIPAIAIALDIKLTDSTPALDHVQAELGAQRLLLVLDNLEQVLDAAPDLLKLLQQCPELRMLITSQEPLRVAEETVVRIPPLAIPLNDADYSEAELLQFASVALFVDRLRQTQPTFQMTSAAVPFVREICQRLHGLPLAIEIVAANSRQMPLRDVLLLLKNYLPPLDSGTPLRRSDIIQPVLDWCYKIMPPVLQRVYPQLGVFHGGWTQDLAQAVCMLNHPGWTVDTLHRALVARHLVLSEERADGTLRYSMVDAVVEDARRRLADDPQLAQYALRHAQTFERLTAQVHEQWRRGDVSIAKPYAQLEVERANTRAALNWSINNRQLPLAARMAAALSRFWMNRGDVHEAQDWLELLLGQQQQLESAEIAGLQYGAGLIYFRLGQLDDARRVWEHSLKWFEAQQDTELCAQLWNNLATIASNHGKFEQARRLLEKAREFNRQQGKRYLETLNIANIALSYARENRYEDAIPLYQEALALCDVIDAEDLRCSLMGNLGCCYVELDDFTTAIPLLQQSIDLHKQLGLWAPFTMTRYLALVYMRLNDLPTAYPLVVETFKQYIDSKNNVEISFGLELLSEWFFINKQSDYAADLWLHVKAIREYTGIHTKLNNAHLRYMAHELERLIAAKQRQQPLFNQDSLDTKLSEALATLLMAA